MRPDKARELQCYYCPRQFDESRAGVKMCNTCIREHHYLMQTRDRGSKFDVRLAPPAPDTEPEESPILGRLPWGLFG